MKTTVWLRDGDTPLEHATTREWADRYAVIIATGRLLICDTGPGPFPRLDEAIDAGTWLKVEVEA